MSYTKEITVWCDNNMCDRWDTIPVGRKALITQANKEATRSGWKIKGRIHLCPYCAKKYDIVNGEIADIER